MLLAKTKTNKQKREKKNTLCDTTWGFDLVQRKWLNLVPRSQGFSPEEGGAGGRFGVPNSESP